MTRSTSYVAHQFSHFRPIFGHRPMFQPFYYPDEGGGAEDGAEGGGGDGAEGGEGGGGAAPQAYEFKDENALFKFPGMDKPMTVKAYREAHLPRTHYDGAMKAMGAIAEALKQRQAAAPKPKPQAQEQDMLAALEGMDLPDGKSVAQVLRQFSQSQFTPVVKALSILAEQMKEVRGHVGRFSQRELEDGFGNDTQSIMKQLKLPEGKIEGTEVVSEMLRDFFHGHHEDDHDKLRANGSAELGRRFAERFQAERKFFKALEKAELVAAQERARKMRFVRPGGNTSGNGKGKPALMSNAQLANLAFTGEPST